MRVLSLRYMYNIKGCEKRMKRIQSVMPIAILLLSAMVVFAGTAAGTGGNGGNGGNGGCQHTISGTITDANNANNAPCVRCAVKITSGGQTVDCCTDDVGYYEVHYQYTCHESGEVIYVVRACGQYIDTCQCDKGEACTADCSGTCTCCGNPIPEFTTIAIPAVALLGLVAVYRRKQKK